MLAFTVFGAPAWLSVLIVALIVLALVYLIRRF